MRKHKADPIPAFVDPLEVSVIDGEVVISGPEWLHAAMVPRAAKQSADRLVKAAKQATEHGWETGDDVDDPTTEAFDTPDR